MKNKISRILTAIIPFVGAFAIWCTWELKVVPQVNKVFHFAESTKDFHKKVDAKIVSGKITKDEAIYILKQNTLNLQESDMKLAAGFKAVLTFLFLGLSVCILFPVIRVIVLEVRSGWKL